LLRSPPFSTLFPYTTLFRSLYVVRTSDLGREDSGWNLEDGSARGCQRRAAGIYRSSAPLRRAFRGAGRSVDAPDGAVPSLRNQRSEEHTSELQSPYELVCRL